MFPTEAERGEGGQKVLLWKLGCVILPVIGGECGQQLDLEWPASRVFAVV